MILLVTYDLKTSGHNYKPFYDALKVQGAWWHYLGPTWLIDTTKSPKDVYNDLASHITTSDNLLVIQVAHNYWGFLPKEAWEWFGKHNF